MLVFFPSSQAQPAEPNQLQKKKYWEAVQPGLNTDDQCVVTYKGRPMRTSAGPVKSTSLAQARIG